MTFKKSIPFIAAIVALLAVTSLRAQDRMARKSPPATATGVIGESTITIKYSQPSVRERKIWGDLVPYNQVWRTGANEATTFETSKDITIEGKVLPAGKYALFTIPNKDEWSILFNTKADQWGDFKYDAGLDKLEVKVKPVKTETFTEVMTFAIEANRVVLRWEKLEVGFNVK